MADGTKKRPASIPIQSVTLQQPVQQAPTFTGQPQVYVNNQYPLNAPATNTPATLGLIFGLAGFGLTFLGFIFPFFCFFSWFLVFLALHLAIQEPATLSISVASVERKVCLDTSSVTLRSHSSLFHSCSSCSYFHPIMVVAFSEVQPSEPTH